jgi:hypothetical protein
LASVEVEFGLVTYGRADTKTGADWYVGLPGDMEDDENPLRLEVSGSDQGNSSDISRRLREKVEQARRGISELPAIAGVVGFLARTISFEKVDD